MSISEFYESWPNLIKELMDGGRLCSVNRMADGVWRTENQFPLETGEQLVVAHNKMVLSGNNQILKQSKKRCVSAPVYNGVPYIVKEFFRPGPWGRHSADARCWLHNWGLKLCDIPVPQALAWHRDLKGHGYVISQFVEGQNAYHALQDSFCQEREFLDISLKICLLVKKLHEYRIVHEDLKLNNLIWNGRDLWLIDNDAVLFNKKITRRYFDRNRRHLVRNCEDPVLKKLSIIFDEHIAF